MPVPSGASAGTQVLEPADALAATNAAHKLASEPSSLIGTTIAGRYQVTKKLGEGGMGTVYQATHTVLEKQVALKVLHPELARKAHLVDRFLQEAKAASRIRHENVIDISDFGAADGHVFFAMELLQGHDLHEEVTRARSEGKLLPWARSKPIFLQICSALSVAHDRGIVHRDLKPENIYLVDFRGDPDFVKLLDFGIAKMTDVSSNEEGRKLTKTGMLFGTPEYMAPEQARGEKVDHRVDIYAMGCILFLLVSNRLPFQADSFMGVLSQHLTDDPPEIAPETFDQIGAPHELADVIDRALEKDRELRWQSMDEMVAAICEACGDPTPKERSKPTKLASVVAPGETTRLRTPTDPARSRTPSGSQRVKRPTGGDYGTPTNPGRPRTATGPQQDRTPSEPPRRRTGRTTGQTPEVSWVGSPVESEPSPRRRTGRTTGQTPEVSWVGDASESARARRATGQTPEVSWVGNAAEPAKVVTLGPVPEPEQKGMAMAIVAGLVVIAAIAGGAYALGWFGGGDDKDKVVTPAGSGSGSATAPSTTSIIMDSSPQGASIIALPGTTIVGHTPSTVTIPSSDTMRQFKLVLDGYEEMTIDVVPNQARIELKPEMPRVGGAPVTPTPEVKPPVRGGTVPTTQVTMPTGNTSTAVTKPDTSTAVTKPDTSTVETPTQTPTPPTPTPTPPPPPKEENPAPPEPKPAPDPAPAP